MNENLFMNCFLGKMKMLSIDIRSKGFIIALIFDFSNKLFIETLYLHIWNLKNGQVVME